MIRHTLKSDQELLEMNRMALVAEDFQLEELEFEFHDLPEAEWVSLGVQTALEKIHESRQFIAGLLASAELV